MKIIYIEDNPTNLFLVKKILEKQNIDFLSAITGEEGLQLVKQKIPDIVLLDINLPGLSGYEIAKEIRRDSSISDCTLIAISANNMDEDKKIAYAVGCDGYIEKPISPKTFYKEILMIHQNENNKIVLHDKEHYLDKYTNKLIDTLKDKINQLEHSNIMLQKVDKIKSDFISVASHELKTPIVPITGYMDLLLKDKFGPLNDKQKEVISKISDSAVRLSNIINRIIDMARLEKGLAKLSLSSFYISNLIHKVVANLIPLAELRNISLDVAIDNDEEIANCDEDKIEFVIYNIVNNAIKFSKDGSTIKIGSFKNKDNTITVFVMDHGIGIEQQDKELVFDKFFSGWDTGYHHTSNYEFKGRGIGLGLSISRDFIMMHNGKIWVESEGKDKGSTFYFTIQEGLNV